MNFINIFLWNLCNTNQSKTLSYFQVHSSKSVIRIFINESIFILRNFKYSNGHENWWKCEIFSQDQICWLHFSEKIHKSVFFIKMKLHMSRRLSVSFWILIFCDDVSSYQKRAEKTRTILANQWMVLKIKRPFERAKVVIKSIHFCHFSIFNNHWNGFQSFKRL